MESSVVASVTSLESLTNYRSLPMLEAVARDISTMDNEELKDFMDKIDAIVFDCDGVLWLGMEPMKNATELVNSLRKWGKKVFFMTNNSTKTRDQFLEKFNNLGFNATKDEIMSTAYLAALYLKEKEFKKKVYVIGSPGITEELTKVGIESLPIGPDVVPGSDLVWKAEDFDNIELDPEVGAVIVGFDHHFSYNKALRAASYLNTKDGDEEDRIFIATNTDEQFPARGDRRLTFPGTGTFVNAVKTCAGKEPVIMGKPEPFGFELVQKIHNLERERVLMVGDRGNTDMLFGRKCDIWTLLVFSGVTDREMLFNWMESTDVNELGCVPNFFAEDVNEFFQKLLDCGFNQPPSATTEEENPSTSSS